jgi:hypothetical protein
MKFVAIRDAYYTICNRGIVCYHYDIRPSQRENAEKYTPYKEHILSVQKFEGKYHPICKIDAKEYKNYNITENYIFFKQKKIVYNGINHPNDDSKIKDDNNTLLIGFVTCQYHALIYRYSADRERTYNNMEVNPAHVRAGLFAVNRLINFLKLLKKKLSKYDFECVDNDFTNIFKGYDDIYDYYNSLNKPMNNPRAMRPRMFSFGIDEQTECALCLRKLGKVNRRGYSKKVVIPYKCEHMFHEQCINKWAGGCPMCRETVTRGEYLINEILNKYHIQDIKVNDNIWIYDSQNKMNIIGRFYGLFYEDSGIYIRLQKVKTIYQTNTYNFEHLDISIDQNIKSIRVIRK